MGVSSTINRVALSGDGISTSFPFPYYFFRQVDLIVYVYDTLLGGISGPLALNSDYIVSGTPNFQGLYPSGANVVMAVAPLTTDILIIIRSPIEQQNYALLQGGTISSAAIVQQFDYLTLLVQRLEDQVSRCIQLPDGLGAAFASQLPATVALSPGDAPIVNPAGNGWILGAGGGGGGGGSSFVVTDGGDTNFSIPNTAQYVRTTTALTAPRTWTLPSAVTVGQEIIIKNTQTFALTIDANGFDTIDGLSSIMILPGNGVAFICGQNGRWDIN